MEQTDYTSLFAANTKTLALLVSTIKMIFSHKNKNPTLISYNLKMYLH